MSRSFPAPPKQKVQVSGNGLGFGGALFLLFLGLKLGGAIDWSWWWVTSPLWIPLALIATFFGFFGFLFLGALALNKSFDRTIRERKRDDE